MDTLRKDQFTFFIISRSILLRMGNVSDKSCIENQDVHFMLNNFFPKIVPFLYNAENIVKRGKPHIPIWHMRSLHN
jgi:hypothetical protein